MIYRELIEETRKIVENSLRKENSSSYLDYKMKAPAWVNSNYPEFKLQYKQQENLLKKAEIFWAHSVQANSMLFEAGDEDHPGTIVYSPDSYFDENIEFLEDIARELSEAKHLEFNSPEIEPLAKALKGERCSKTRKVPVEITDGRAVYMTSLVYCRKFLPNQFMIHRAFPLFAMPQTRAVLAVPEELWAPGIRAQWRGEWTDASSGD